ncbi:uncharacterized protein K452DRAFT_42520 [Aplosporella prunicola CBS 121167]|uniref:Uncharacterized protein n=1 Tax=Aplosporella prunicola CBS 121167 TaxID=1176127 RepID=A0A6A6BDC2_9PEZI|nr:uncharacterized protein K452DRAFT_42520 [Aplosporella prunicola CBS 121167]KAF2140897.1 hypothetical protein K452DRAFT_42520 [Aplosporella prunicola CBS 121167]
MAKKETKYYLTSAASATKLSKFTESALLGSNLNPEPLDSELPVSDSDSDSSDSERLSSVSNSSDLERRSSVWDSSDAESLFDLSESEGLCSDLIAGMVLLPKVSTSVASSAVRSIIFLMYGHTKAMHR